MTRAEWDAAVEDCWHHYMNELGIPAQRAAVLAREYVTREHGPRPAAEPKPEQPQGEKRAPWYLRLGARVAGSIVGSQMKDKLNRWLPIIGVVIVAGAAALKAFGFGTAASMLETFGGAIGATTGVAPDVVAAITTGAASLFALYGVIRKLIAVFGKPKA